MSDPKTTPEGEPVVEPVDKDGAVEDVVDRANEGLADAEAAGRDAVDPSATAEPAEPAVAEGVAVSEETTAVPVSEPIPETPAPETPAAGTGAAVADDATPWYDRPLEDTPGAAHDAEPAAAPVVVPVAASEPTALVPDAFVASSPQPIFVQAPEAPRPRGNRGAAGAIGLLAALAFAVLSFGILYGYGFASGTITPAGAADAAIQLATSWVYWAPIVGFFLGFWLLGAILNRARWAHWVVWGLLVGVAAYAGLLVGVLFQAPFWELTARQGRELLELQLFSPYAIMSFVLGRELTIWFGAWVAARGRRMTELNDEAQREYERTLEAGPQLVRS